MTLCDPGTVHALLKRHGFRFSRSMGQNFLTDAQVLQRIADASEAETDCGVLEIGPGIGALTRELSRRAGKVLSIELDQSLLPILSETLADCPNVEIISGDALKLDLSKLAAEKFAGLTPIVCANLPYNITSPMITRLIELPVFQTLTLLMQKEVAQRLSAPVGSAQSGWLSLYLQYHMDTKIIFDVPGNKFMPPPKVTSSLLRCVRRSKPAVNIPDEAFFFQVIRGSFLLRRKTLVNSLSSAFPDWRKETIQKALLSVRLSPTVRGEQLTLEQFAMLAQCLQAARSGDLR